MISSASPYLLVKTRWLYTRPSTSLSIACSLNLFSIKLRTFFEWLHLIFNSIQLYFSAFTRVWKWIRLLFGNGFLEFNVTRKSFLTNVINNLIASCTHSCRIRVISIFAIFFHSVLGFYSVAFVWFLCTFAFWLKHICFLTVLTCFKNYFLLFTLDFRGKSYFCTGGTWTAFIFFLSTLFCSHIFDLFMHSSFMLRVYSFAFDHFLYFVTTYSVISPILIFTAFLDFLTGTFIQHRRQLRCCKHRELHFVTCVCMALQLLLTVSWRSFLVQFSIS